MSDYIDKIKKLLRLSKSSNQHEAELALIRALEIADRYQVDIESIAMDDNIRKLIHDRIRVGARITQERRLAHAIVDRFFNVTSIMAHPDMLLIGTATDIEIAKYVVEFLVGTCRRCLKQYNHVTPRPSRGAAKKPALAVRWRPPARGKRRR